MTTDYKALAKTLTREKLAAHFIDIQLPLHIAQEILKAHDKHMTQVNLWKRVAELARSAYAPGCDFDTESFVEGAMEEFSLTCQPGIKCLMEGDRLYCADFYQTPIERDAETVCVTLYKPGHTVTVTVEQDGSVLTAEGIRFRRLFIDGDCAMNGSGGPTEWYLVQPTPVDYRTLLKKYMQAVMQIDGTSSIEDADTTDSEFQMLRKIHQELTSRRGQEEATSQEEMSSEN